jgi:uncharacterized membrane protein YkoI
MTRRTIITIASAAAVVALATGGVVAANRLGDDQEQPITGNALQRATEAALAHTGGGRVTGTEVGDEDSLYEVEVTLDDGRQIDVQLDEQFRVVDTMADRDGAED